MKQRDKIRVHKESLLRIPLVSQMFADPGFSIIQRGVDSRWNYSGAVSSRIDGFNPLYSAAFIGKHSHIDEWLPHRHKSARKFNHDDNLIGEVLFAVHDYLHTWAYRWIAELYPSFGFGTKPITKRNFEDMVFCHLLTEAVATVGLDYWYLSCTDLNSIVPIGTLHKGLTVSYDESRSAEYLRACPGLKIQDPEFLVQLTQFYCEGEFYGFDVKDVLNSPAIGAWLKHELQYGKLQRQYCRQWYSYLSNGRVELANEALAQPIEFSSKFRKKLTYQISERLWAKVKQDELCNASYSFNKKEIWTAKLDSNPSYMFSNLNKRRLPSDEAIQNLEEKNYTYLLRQYMARFDYGAFPKEAIDIFKLMRENKSLSLGKLLFKDMKVIHLSKKEPDDVFLYN